MPAAAREHGGGSAGTQDHRLLHHGPPHTVLRRAVQPHGEPAGRPSPAKATASRHRTTHGAGCFQPRNIACENSHVAAHAGSTNDDNVPVLFPANSITAILQFKETRDNKYLPLSFYRVKFIYNESNTFVHENNELQILCECMLDGETGG